MTCGYFRGILDIFGGSHITINGYKVILILFEPQIERTEKIMKWYLSEACNVYNTKSVFYPILIYKNVLLTLIL